LNSEDEKLKSLTRSKHMSSTGICVRTQRPAWVYSEVENDIVKVHRNWTCDRNYGSDAEGRLFTQSR